MFLHHFVCSVHFPTVQKHTGFEIIPHLYWKNDKGIKPANGFQPAFSGHSVAGRTAEMTGPGAGTTRQTRPSELALRMPSTGAEATPRRVRGSS